jgi:arylsulfatase A-like enzyme
MVHRDEHLASYPRDEKEIKRHIAEYFAMITHLDFEIGRLLDALKESGEEDNTIIVFTGDNGLAVGQHGWLGKEDIYEHGVRIPLIMAGPGIAKGKRNDAYVYLYDIFPTLCEKVGIDIPSSVDGKSFAELLDGEHGEKFRDELYLIFDNFVRGVKDENYKLIEYRNGDNMEDKWTFLYDINNDPWETKNLANNENYKDKVNEMREKIIKHRDEWEEQSHPWGIDFWKRF